MLSQPPPLAGRRPSGHGRPRHDLLQIPKNGTFELIQSLTEILAFEAHEAQEPNPPPSGRGASPGTPHKKKEPYKCACHCTLIICGCMCRTLPLLSFPPGSYEQGGGSSY